MLGDNDYILYYIFIETNILLIDMAVTISLSFCLLETRVLASHAFS